MSERVLVNSIIGMLRHRWGFKKHWDTMTEATQEQMRAELEQAVTDFVGNTQRKSAPDGQPSPYSS